MMMPVMDGWGFLEQMRKIVPIIVTSGVVGSSSSGLERHENAMRILRKPIDYRDLLISLAQALPRWRGTP
jgi:CheY-like chemotaxis protein